MPKSYVLSVSSADGMYREFQSDSPVSLLQVAEIVERISNETGLNPNKLAISYSSRVKRVTKFGEAIN